MQPKTFCQSSQQGGIRGVERHSYPRYRGGVDRGEIAPNRLYAHMNSSVSSFADYCTVKLEGLSDRLEGSSSRPSQSGRPSRKRLAHLCGGSSGSKRYPCTPHVRARALVELTSAPV